MNHRRASLSLVLAFAILAPYVTAHAQDGLTFRQLFFSVILDNVMQVPRQVAVTPDGTDVYVAAETSEGVVQFRRDASDGTLEFASFTTAQFDKNSPRYRVTRVIASSNNRFVYAAIVLDSTAGVACFQRNLSTGQLTLVDTLLNDDPAIQGLVATSSMIFSRDGQSIYLLGTNSTSAATEAIAEIAIDATTGFMSPIQWVTVQPVTGFAFGLPYYQLVASPDGRNLYVAAGTQGGVQVFNIDSGSGAITFDTMVNLPGLNTAVVQSVAISPNGQQVYAADSMNGTLWTLARDAAGNLTVPSRSARGLAGITPLPGITKIVASPDGAKLYTLSFGELVGSIAHVSAFARDAQTGVPELLETVVDGLAGTNVLSGNELLAVSPDSGNLYLPAGSSSSLAVFSSERPNLPCTDFPALTNELEDLQTEYTLDEDIDQDGLPESASFALVNQSSCGIDIDEGFDEAITNAYLVNLASTGSELEVYETGEWVPYQRSLGVLRLISASMGMYLNNAFDPFALQMHDFYVSVSCTDGACEPANARSAALRSANEPFSGEGDPDEDGFTNAEEWANVLARGGTAEEFAASALDPANDGSSVVIVGSSSNGSCFIATAAYGTPLAAELGTLRTFRDSQLLPSAVGAGFADAYYRLSPPAAQFIAERPLARSAVRAMLSAGAVNSPRLVGIMGVLASALLLSYRCARVMRTLG